MALFWLVFKIGSDISVINQPAGDIIIAGMSALLACIGGRVSGRPRAGR
jgi:hypothetical protein